MNDLEITITDPIGPEYIYGISEDLTVEGILREQDSPTFTSDANEQPILLGQFYKIYYRDIRLHDNYAEDRTKIFRVTDENGAIGLTPPLQAVLAAGNVSTLNAIIAKLFTTQSREITDNSRVVFAGINLATGELVQLPDSVVRGRVGGSGNGSTQPVQPGDDTTFTGKLVTYKGGAYYAITIDQAIAKVLTLQNLYNQIKTATVANRAGAQYVWGESATGAVRIPASEFGTGSGGTGSTFGISWVDLPVGNYADFPDSARWFHVGTSPASTVGTNDMLTLELVYGPWGNVNGQLTQTRIIAEIKNRDGFAAEIKERWGRGREAEIRSFLQTDNSVKHYIYFTAQYFVVGFVRGHGIGGASFNPELTPTIGTDSEGAVNNRIKPSGRELWSTGTAKPVWDYTGEEHRTYLPITTEDLATMAKAKITNVDLLPAGLSRAEYAEYGQLLHNRRTNKVVRAEGKAYADYIGSQYGILGLAESADFVLGPQVVTPPGTNIIPLGASFSRTIDVSTFVSPSGLALTLSASGPVPAGLGLSGTTVSGTGPTASGTFVITIRATDTNGAFAETKWTIVVLPGNRAPFIPEIPAQNASLTTQTTISLYPLYKAIDPDGDAVTYGFACETNLISFDNGTTSLQITVPSGLTPGKSYWFQLKATDTAGNITARQFDIVIPPAGLTDFAMATPTMDCANMRITINTVGGATNDIKEYRILGVRDWSANRVFDLPAGIVNDPNTTKLTLQARIGTNIVQVVDYLFRATCTPAGAITGPTAPSYSPRTVVVGGTISIPVLDFTPPSGATITGVTYEGLPSWLVVGPELVGGGLTSSPTIHGTAAVAGNYPIIITGKSSNGGETKTTLSITVTTALVGGFSIQQMSNPGKFQATGQIINGEAFYTHTNYPGYGKYWIDGSGSVYHTALNTIPFPTNGQTKPVLWFAGDSPADANESAMIHVTYNNV